MPEISLRPFLKTEEIQVISHRREEFIDITSEIQDFIDRANIQSGLIALFVPHTTAAVTINENADPDVKSDILHKLNRQFPQNDSYRHAEGNSDAHIKSSLIGSSLLLIVAERKLLLGTWQGVYFCEFDGPRNRKLFLKVISG
jgi:secondary thiamine-phosphate synthase enzyme